MRRALQDLEIKKLRTVFHHVKRERDETVTFDFLSYSVPSWEGLKLSRDEFFGILYPALLNIELSTHRD